MVLNNKSAGFDCYLWLAARPDRQRAGVLACIEEARDRVHQNRGLQIVVLSPDG
jgi:hypothetical protein